MVNKIKRYIKTHKQLIIVCTLLFFFPLAVGVIYALPLPQIIAVDSGDLLAYYGTAFGIFGSFYVYRDQTKKQRKEREKELKPILFVDVIQDKRNPEIFTIKIVNKSESTLSYFYLYDELVSPVMKKNYFFRVAYCPLKESAEKIEVDYNFNDSDLLDSDGKPKYVQILCDDIDGNVWNCCYYKTLDGNQIHYFPGKFEIL